MTKYGICRIGQAFRGLKSVFGLIHDILPVVSVFLVPLLILNVPFPRNEVLGVVIVLLQGFLGIRHYEISWGLRKNFSGCGGIFCFQGSVKRIGYE